jgi:hypothetical protein
MKELPLTKWSELQQWLAQYEDGQTRFAFRGQADSKWELQTSLARHFSAHYVDEHQWRQRELKMYCEFRERLLKTCPCMYEKWDALDILSLMQHHGAPTRMLDFSYDPRVAAFFALEDSRGDSAIWVVDGHDLENRRNDMGLAEYDYCGPKHDPYDVFHKDDKRDYRRVGFIRSAKEPHARLAAQRGCFFVTGSISNEIDHHLVHTKVTLSNSLVVEPLKHPEGEPYSRECLFPDLDQLAKQARRLSVIGDPDCSCGGIAGKGS